MKKSLLLIFLMLGAVLAQAPHKRDAIIVKRFEASKTCAHYSSYVSVDYPVSGPAATVIPLKNWLDSTLECGGKIGKGGNPAKNCIVCNDVTVDQFRSEYPDVTDGDLGVGFDSTKIFLESQTEHTQTYLVEHVILNNGAAHENYTSPRYVLVKGRALGFSDIFSADSNTVVARVRELAKTEPSNQGDCRAHWGEIKEIHWVYPARDGLAFVWATYAVNCGVCGNVTLKLPYRQFKGMLKPQFEEILKEIQE